MNDRKAALIARILELLEARKDELRRIAEADNPTTIPRGAIGFPNAKSW